MRSFSEKWPDTDRGTYLREPLGWRSRAIGTLGCCPAFRTNVLNLLVERRLEGEFARARILSPAVPSETDNRPRGS